jgi:hypothetical protein
MSSKYRDRGHVAARAWRLSALWRSLPWLSLPWLSLPWIGLMGCADETASSASPTGSGTEACQAFDTPWDAYVAGIEKTGSQGAVKIALLNAVPTPPGLDENSWTVRISDAAGAPMTTATITKIKPWMPDHGHGTDVVPVVGAIDASGEALIDALDFRMPGVWTTTFDVDTGAGVDSVVFSFCIDG